MSTESPVWHDDLVEHRHADLSEVRLHYVEAGDGPLVVLLHGFPEFWYSWRHQIAALSNAGYRVIAPDMRGYNTSSKPPTVRDYTRERLARDVADLIAHCDCEQATVVGHDWGGIVAWYFAMQHPDRLARLVIMNAPHPAHFLGMLRSLKQLGRSAYIALFQVPGVAERRIERDDFEIMRKTFRYDPINPDAFSDEDIQRYVDAFRQPGAVTAALCYYRALVRHTLFRLEPHMRPITAPTQILWGVRDRYIGREFAEPPRTWVPEFRFFPIENASHWVQVDRPEEVNHELLDFLSQTG